MKRKILLILAVIFLILSAGLFYVNKVLLPVQVKGMLVKTLQEQTGRKVSLAGLQWGPVRGLQITELVIYDKGRPSETFLHIPSASVQILLAPFFSKKIIIPSVTIRGLSLNLTRTGETIWNFSDLITPQGAASGGTPSFDMIIGGFSVLQAKIIIADRSTEQEFAETISPLTIRGSFSLGNGLQITGDLLIPSTEGTVKFDTRTDLREKTFQGDIKLAKIDSARYLRFLPDPLPLKIKTATIKAADLSIMANKKDLTISASASFPGLDVETSDNKFLQADLSLNKFTLTSKSGKLSVQGEFLANKTRSGWDAHSFTGDLRLNLASLSMENGELRAAADVEARNVLALLSEGQKLQGQFTISGLKVSQKKQLLTATADAQVKSFSLQTKEGPAASGDLTLSGIQARIDDTRSEFRSQLKCEKLKIQSGEIILLGELTTPDLTVLIDEALDIKLSARLGKGQVSLPQNMIFSGEPSATLHLRSQDKALSYNGLIRLANGTLKGLPSVDAAENINAEITLTTDALSTKDLSFRILGAPVSISGEVTRFARPLLDIEASAKDADLSLIERLVPHLLKEYGIKISGKTDITAQISGEASRIDQARISAVADIKNARIESAKLPQPLENISGTVTYAPPGLSWRTLSVDLQKKSYILNGHLQDFTNPQVTTSIKNNDLMMDVQANKSGDDILIKALTASFLDSSLTASGRLTIPEGQPPLMDMLLNGKIRIRDIPWILPQYEKEIAALKIDGNIKLQAGIKGALTDWQKCHADITLSSPTLSLMGYEIKDLNLTALAEQGKVAPLKLTASLYGGRFEASSSLELTELRYPFTAVFDLANLDLALLKRDIPALQQKQIAGSLAVSGSARGRIMDWKNLDGEGKAAVTNGHLWEFPLLTKVLGILSTSLQGGDVIITEASATLNAEEGRIHTNDLTLKSATVSLIGEGWIDLDQNVDLNITPRLESRTGTISTAPQSADLTEGLLNLHVTGTLSQPKITTNLSAPTVIKKTIQDTVGNLLKIFE